MRQFPSAGRLLVAASLATLLTGAYSAPRAHASQLLDRNATDVRLAVDNKGEALVSYQVAGKVRHVLVWGAINARPPSRSEPQVAFRMDYAGGYGSYHRDYWKTFGTSCEPYDGPPLAWLVVACKAPDGSYWALQSWQRELPDVGVIPTTTEASWELRVSHWRGPLPVLAIETDWAYRRYDHLFGTLSYRGQPQYGFRTTSSGQPLDSYGREIYLDTLDSAYGPGWRRENSFLTHTGTGAFCYGFFPGQNGSDRPAGNGSEYRATVIGPGVTPDLSWQGPAPGPYNQAADARANDDIRALHDRLCKPN
jgi:hypothetical protein